MTRSSFTSAARALCVCALLSWTVGASAAASEAGAATLYFNAHVFTAEPDRPYADAVAVRGDRILAVGPLRAVEAAAGPDAARRDLGGKFLMPGMIDAHAHPIAGGIALLAAHYSDSRASIPDLVRFVQDRWQAKVSRQGPVLVIYDLDNGFWSHAADIDAALSRGEFARRPVVLYGSDGHTAWANGAARRLAGIDARFIRGLPVSDRQYYGADAHGNPNGFLVDAGMVRLDRSVPPPSEDRQLAAGRAAVHYMNSQGITGWLDASVSGEFAGSPPADVRMPGYLPVYEQLARRGELTVHVAAYPVVQVDRGNGQLDAVEALQAKYRDVPNLRVPGLKVFADGVVEFPSQTAALTKPYLNSGRPAPLLFDPAEMKALVTEADRRGLIVHVHAIGDRAVRASLDALEAARRANPAGVLPHALTHAQFVAADDVPRFGALRVVAALQLLWAVADPATVDPVQPYVDPGIYRRMYPARSLLDGGAVLAGASDWPVSSANPFAAMAQAELRTGSLGVLDAAQRMPRMAMLYAYTRNAALALDDLPHIGSIAPGKLADLVLVDRDVAVVPPEELKDAKVLWTMLGGQVVYEAVPSERPTRN